MLLGVNVIAIALAIAVQAKTDELAVSMIEGATACAESRAQYLDTPAAHVDVVAAFALTDCRPLFVIAIARQLGVSPSDARVEKNLDEANIRLMEHITKFIRVKRGKPL
jgi:hypothetical protein